MGDPVLTRNAQIKAERRASAHLIADLRFHPPMVECYCGWIFKSKNDVNLETTWNDHRRSIAGRIK